MTSLPPTDASSVVVLPLHSLSAIRDPSIFLPLLRRVAQRTTDRLLVLCHGSALHPRDSSDQAGWSDLQRFLGVVYSAVAQEAARHDRVLFEVDVLIEGFAGDERAGGRAGGVASFGRVGGKWDRVWVSDRKTDGEEDQTLLAACLQHLPDKSQITTFPNHYIPPASRRSSSDDTRPQAVHAEAASPPTETYPVVAVGGTFDHLHAGHKILLSMCVWLATRKVIVGVSDDALLTSKAHASLLEPLATRIARVKAFLALLNPRLELEVVPLRDVAGPTGWDPDVQALVVSRESVSGGEMIAGIRRDKGLPPLEQHVIDVITASRTGSSTQDDLESAASGEFDGGPHLLEHERDPGRLKTLKLGSTYIREWLARRQGSKGTTSR